MCNWLPFYRPYSFAPQSFGWFAKYEVVGVEDVWGVEKGSP